MTEADRWWNLAGRSVAVLGAGSGIGAAVAAGAGRAGAVVHCFDVDVAAADAVAARLQERGAKAEAALLDVRDGMAVRAALERVRSLEGRLDVVVSTPGINVRKRLVDYTDDEFDRVVALNLKGSFLVLREAGRIMAPAGRGSIVLFSSIRSQVVEPGQGVYAATKAGIVQLVRAAAAELGPANVRVNALAPGIVDTSLTGQIKADPAWSAAYAAKNALGRWARVEEMVGPTLFLASDASSYVTGTVLFADAGWTAIDGRFEPPGMEHQPTEPGQRPKK